ncbi:siderophore ABC transporter substrate-binding protein [Bergeriella denitrificans]|uniref:Membrane transport solute-binding protein n=1 Tax=Bergeriella denitrificans TaxID=494 RepID=A0A378UDV3_BERDE|nr:siderophore ABC transporter substrate-binding protein [Bergeriella denitrificans]STZ75594.1 membrane transport solute-binding protein [Bergeriella denitrificans]
MKYTRLTLALCAALSLAACKPSENAAGKPAENAPAASAAAHQHEIAGETVTIATTRGEATVPLKPERIAVYDLGMIDTLSKLGVPIGASVDQSRLTYTQDAIKDAVKAGTLFEPNYEALHAYKPQLIIIGSRAAKAFDQLNAIAPTIEMTADTKNLKDSAKERITAFGKVFGKEAEAEKLNAEIDTSFEAAKQAAAGKGNGLVILVNGGKMSAYGPLSRLGGWLHTDIGIPAADTEIKEGSHGQPVTFEYIKEKNPDWLFVLDRSAAIGEEGTAAKDVLDNPLVADTTAAKKGQIVYLVPETYLAAGGAQELLNATKQVTDAFNAAK